MATYISTLKFTAHGIEKIGESTKRVAAFKAAAKKLGAKITSAYWTLGTYDGVLIFEAPDDETATVVMLKLSQLGNVQTSTMRAFDGSEFEKIAERV